MRINLSLTDIKNNTKRNFKTFKPQNIESLNTQSPALNSLTPPINYFMPNLNLSFKGRCPEDAFAVKDILNLHCPVCGQIMLNKAQLDEIASQMADKKGEKLVRVIEFYEDERNITQDKNETEKRSVFRGQQQEIVKTIKELALTHPTLNLSELIKIEAERCLGELIVVQMDVVRELEAYLNSANLAQGELESLNYIIQVYKNQILGKNEKRFKRQAFIHDLKHRVQDEAIQVKINEIISKLPNSSNSIDSFFVKWGFNNSSCKEIAYNLVYDARPTAEHLVPKSKGGKNDTLNYLCDCAECNSKRGNTDFKDWVKTIPNFEQKLQDQLETIAKCLDSGTLDYAYYSYLEGIIQVISDLSDNTINLTLPKICNSPEIIHAERKRANGLKRAQEAMNELEIKISTLKEEIRQLQQYPHYNEISYLKTLLEKEAGYQEAIKSGNEELARIDEEQKEIARIKKKITDIQLQLAKMKDSEGNESYSEKSRDLESYRTNLAQRNEQQLYSDRTALEARIERLEAKLESSQNLIERVKETSREKLISIRIAELSRTLDSSNEIYKKLSSYRSTVSKESSLRSEHAAKLQENAELEEQNAQIRTRLNTNNVSQDKYLKYLHLMELTDEAASIKEQKRNRKNKNLMELIDLAQGSISSQTSALLEDETVIYFFNLDKLAQNKKRIEAIAKELAQIEEIKAKISSCEQTLQEINKNQSFEENSQEHAKLSEEFEAIQKAKNVPKMKQELEELENTFKYYTSLLNQLTGDSKLQDTEFFRIINIICSKN